MSGIVTFIRVRVSLEPEAVAVLCYNRRATMKHLWSPWRMAYIEERNAGPGCLFCQRLAEARRPR